MPSFQSAGMPRMARERSITSARRAFGLLGAVAAAEEGASKRVQRKPGRLAQGPEEKLGLAGRMSGLLRRVPLRLSLSEEKRPGGGA